MSENSNPWIEVPSSTTFSREQKEVYAYSLNDNLMINGVAGSGKTILAIRRAEQLQDLGKKVLFIVFTNILHQFTKIAAKESGLKIEGPEKKVDVLMLQDLTKKSLGFRVMKMESLTDQQIKRLINMTGGYDHVIIDEGQDFNMKIYNEIFSKMGNIHTICLDKKQSIFPVDFNTGDLVDIYEPIKEKILNFTYRNPKNILLTSMKFFKNRFEALPTAIKDIKVYNKTDGQVLLVNTNNEIDSITTLIKNRGKNTVGVLLPNNASVKHFHDRLSARDIGPIELRYNHERNWDDTVSFENINPKIMTYYSAKGIQFDYVIIPLLNNEYGNEIGFSNKVEEARAFYVAMTRTKKALYFTKTSNFNCPYMDDIPDDHIKELDRNEDVLPDIEDIFDFGDDNVIDDDLPF